jgi:glycosyltransferase involved in cell wall biosynthesis
MRIVLNLLPLKTGGGIQVALDFMAWAQQAGQQHEWLIVCRENTPFRQRINGNLELAHIVPDNLPHRLWFEYVGCRKFLGRVQPDIIFTLFGPQWPGASDELNVVGCAYSNLFYPEIDFWRALPLYRRVLKTLIDRQRLRRLRKADIKIFETTDLAQRAMQQNGFLPETVHVVPPACSSLVSAEGFDTATAERCRGLPDGFRILLIAGYHPNKNFDILVDTAVLLRRSGLQMVRFVLTLPATDPGAQAIFARADKLGVADQIVNFGPVPPQGCCELYRGCDAAVLPSTLESFSNMIAESWAMQKPLLISDLDWARSLCGDGAIYFAHRNPQSLCEAIQLLVNGGVDVTRLMQSGLKQLQQYPSARQRFERYMDVIERSVVSKAPQCM